ncbi:hypothetical protein BEL04_06765 [Mucilaginibacter sp. PPCGB 2223]|nr:hypothetical protein BEL04_06765 [Mucilaginibacter sp. PPCGB 2223]
MYIYDVIKNFIKISLFTLFLFGGYCHATIANLSRKQQVQKNNKAPASVSKHNSKDAFDAFFNYGSAAQLTSQSFKQVHFNKAAVVFQSRIAACIHSLPHYTGTHVSGLARFYKLILFPFHAFW